MVATPWGDSKLLRERRLSPGPGSSPEAVAQNQRQRLFAAMVASVAEHGYERTRVSDLVETSGVSLRSFYDLFSDKHACFGGAVGALATTTIRRVLEEPDGAGWDGKARDHLQTLASLVAAQPAAAQMCLVEAYVAGDVAADLVDEGAAQVEALIRARLAASSKWAELPPEMATVAVGAILETFKSHLIDGQVEHLPAVAEELASLFLDYEPPVRPLRSAARSPEVRPEQLEASDHAERALRAFEALLTEQGFAGMTMEQVAKRAKMSVRTLYANFPSREKLMLAAIDSAGAQVVAATVPAYRRHPSPPEGIRSAIGALLALLASRPNLAHLILAAAYEGGAPALQRRAEALRPLQGLFVRAAPRRLPVSRALASEALLGGILWLARRRLAEAGPGALVGLSPVCTYIALAPMVGAEQATAAAEGKSYRRQSPELAGPLRLSSVRPLDDRVMTALGEGSFSADELAERTSLTREDVDRQIAAHLEEGAIEKAPGDGNRYRSRWPVQRTKEWGAIDQGRREEISAEIVGAAKDDLDAAMAAGTFDARPERALVRLPLLVDQQGWQELHDALDGSFDECLAIQRRIRKRFDERGDEADGFRVRVHLISFESPE